MGVAIGEIFVGVQLGLGFMADVAEAAVVVRKFIVFSSFNVVQLTIILFNWLL